MTDQKPIACSLGANDLQRRLDEIAELSAVSLIARDTENGKHRLRFRSDPTTRRRLDEIVAAEAECCSFLDLELAERGGEVVLTLTAPDDGQVVADELAAAFAGGSS
ncbi:MAG TPA: hypothetical protein VK471_07890 [Solirubrobacterales bacterium]|nr:hypothetical protein [Solirubrobacterales bacterium]